MNNQKTPWLFGVVAVAIAAMMSRGMLPAGGGGGVGSPAAPAKQDEKKKDGEAKTGKPEETTWKDFCPPACLFEEFFGLPLTAPDADWSQTARTIAGAAAAEGYDLEFLVALVPDPVDSHLAYRFDEALDGLQRAVAQSGYLFDRVSLPWDGEPAKAATYRWMPGSLLFRKAGETGGETGGRARLLAVFLVGESPKGGIQKKALYTALDLVTGLRQEAPGASSTVRILGPTFSGSAESVRIALDAWSRLHGAAPLAVEMVSGTATAKGLENTFRDRPNIHFSRAVVDDSVVQEKAFHFLEERLGWDQKDVALLTEFDTAYGQSAGKNKGPLVIKFPSHLAHIRTAREKLGLDSDPKSRQPLAEGRKSLDLSLADLDKPVDLVPQMSDLATPANDLALAGMLREISHRGSRYVGILATDIQDRLFLAAQIHTNCPDAVVFTFDNHLLDTHPKVARSMNGTLVLTSFPLRLSGDRAVSQLTSEVQAGVYLSTLRLLRPAGGEDPRPAVWVVAVGNGELWPVARLQVATEWPEEPPGLRGPERLGGPGWRRTRADNSPFKWLLSGLGIALLATWLWRLARPLQTAAAGLPKEEKRAVGAGFLPALGLGTLCLAAGVLLVFATLPLWNLPASPWGADLGTNAVLVLVYVGVVFLLTRLVRGWRRTAAIVLGFFLPAFLAFAMRELWLFPEGANFFYRRAGTFGSGLSPLLSLALLAAAVFTWSAVELKRRQLIVIHDLRWPLRSLSDPELAATAARSETLRNALLAHLPGAGFWIGLGLFFLLPLPRLCGAIQPIVERKAYGIVFVGAVMLVFLLAALSFYRFFRAWYLLERMLDPLCHSWLLPALSRESGLIDWKPLKSFGLRMPRIKMTLTVARQLRTLAGLGLLGPDGAVLDGGGGGAAPGVIDEDVERSLRADAEDDIGALGKLRRDLRPWLDRGTALTGWLHRSAGDPLPKDKDGKPVPRDKEVEMREIETFLALRAASYLRYVFAHLRYALASATICGLLLLVAVSSYAFQPKRFLSMGIWGGLLLASLMALRAFLHMDRNGVLSAIGGTDAGKVTLDHTFFSNLLTYFGIPVMGVLLTQFPSIGQLFGDWLEPLLRVVGGS
jgi:hypothetical protein